MSLKRAIARHQLTFHFPRQMPQTFRLAKSRETIERLIVSQPLAMRYEDIAVSRQLVSAHFHEQANLDGISKRHLKRVPWFIFSVSEGMAGEEAAPLAANPAFVRAWFVWLDGQVHSSSLQALFHNFLLHYPEPVVFWGAEIARRLRQGTRPHVRALWERCTRFRLLDPDGPHAFAARLYQADISFYDWCITAGFEGDLASYGFIRQGLHHLLLLLSHHADPEGLSLGQLQTLLQGLRDQQGRLQHLTDFATRLASVLLQPFQRQKADSKLRNFLRDFLLGYLGDPRINPAAWAKVDPQARQVMLGWLLGRHTHMDERMRMFLQEVAKQLPRMEDDVHRLRVCDTATAAPLISRVRHNLHSIAGVAEFFGLSEMIALGTRLETLLVSLQNSAPIPKTIDAILSGFDVFRNLLEEIPGMSSPVSSSPR